jgi:predicted acetyltransferase
VTPADKGVLRELLNLYLYDLSDLVDADPNDHGRFEYPYLDHYWTEPGRAAFFIRADGAPAGFVMVNARTFTGAEHGIAEFFVLSRHRRRGVGRAAAGAAFDAFVGSWEVFTDANNPRAKAFWRSVVAGHTSGVYEELSDVREGLGPVFRFSSGLPPRARSLLAP